MDNLPGQTRGTMKRADRYQKVAGEYFAFAKTAPSPFLREYFQRNAEVYRVRAQSELWVSERGAALAVDRLRA